MNHRAIPLAAGLLLASAAAAQSSVQIWGIVDQGIVKMNDGASIAANPGAGGRNRREVRHAWQPRLGFRGSEDLGDGMQAFFDLEMRFSADDGLPATPFWSGRSVVGLRRAGIGEIRLGRDYNPAFYPAVNLDPWNWNTVGQMGLAATWARYAANDGGPRNNNQVQYVMPNMAGFSAMFALAEAEGATNRGRALGAHLIYNKGPVYVGFAWDQAQRAASATTGTDAQLMLLGAAYDFGVVRPRVLVAKSRSLAGLEIRSAMVGATVPFGVARVLVGYSQIDPAGANNNSRKVGLGYHYNLSVRTMLYADVGSAKTDGLSRSLAWDLGIRHNF